LDVENEEVERASAKERERLIGVLNRNDGSISLKENRESPAKKGIVIADQDMPLILRRIWEWGHARNLT